MGRIRVGIDNAVVAHFDPLVMKIKIGVHQPLKLLLAVDVLMVALRLFKAEVQRPLQFILFRLRRGLDGDVDARPKWQCAGKQCSGVKKGADSKNDVRSSEPVQYPD